MRAILVAGALLGAAAAASAQQRPTITLRGDAAMVWVHTDTGPGRTSQRGPGLGGEGRVGLNGLLLGAGLMEAGLKPVAGAAGPQRDFVQATLFAGGRPLPWLELTIGPVIRAYVTDSTTERWVFWQARARVDAPIVAGRLASYLEAWRAFSSDVNLPTSPGRAQGGEAGVVYQLPQRPIRLRLAYRIDDALLGPAAGNETVEMITLSLGTTLP
jgi:hypothetical protein